MQKVPMTEKGAEKLREELHQLKAFERPQVIKAIATARGHGDLSENAEYHAAKEQQGFIEGRIREIEHKLSHAQIIDLKEMVNDGKVIFGAKVTLVQTESGQTLQYQIVGEDEADLKTGKISVTSPVARALIGKFEGDAVEVQAPQGVISYEIDHVDYV